MIDVKHRFHKENDEISAYNFGESIYDVLLPDVSEAELMNIPSER